MEPRSQKKKDSGKKFILTGIPGEREEAENIYLFRYQRPEAMIKMIRKHAGKKQDVKKKKLSERSGDARQGP